MSDTLDTIMKQMRSDLAAPRRPFYTWNEESGDPLEGREPSWKRARADAAQEEEPDDPSDFFARWCADDRNRPAWSTAGKPSPDEVAAVVGRRACLRAREFGSVSEATQVTPDGLYLYQEAVVESIYRGFKHEGLPGIALALQPGAGKTCCTLTAALRLLAAGSKACCVVLPNSLLSEWHDEVERLRGTLPGFADVKVRVLWGKDYAEHAYSDAYLPDVMEAEMRSGNMLYLVPMGPLMMPFRNELTPAQTTLCRLEHAFRRCVQAFGERAFGFLALEEGRLAANLGETGDMIRRLPAPKLIVSATPVTGGSDHQGHALCKILYTREELLLCDRAVAGGVKMPDGGSTTYCALVREAMARSGYSVDQAFARHAYMVKVPNTIPAGAALRSVEALTAIRAEKMRVIMSIVCAALIPRNGRTLRVGVFVWRKRDVDAYGQAMSTYFPSLRVIVMHAGVSKATRDRLMQRVKQGDFDVLIMTYALGGVGLNLDVLDSIVITDMNIPTATAQQISARETRSAYDAKGEKCAKTVFALLNPAPCSYENYAVKYMVCFQEAYPEYRGVANPYLEAKDMPALHPREHRLLQLAVLNADQPAQILDHPAMRPFAPCIAVPVDLRVPDEADGSVVMGALRKRLGVPGGEEAESAATSLLPMVPADIMDLIKKACAAAQAAVEACTYETESDGEADRTESDSDDEYDDEAVAPRAHDTESDEDEPASEGVEKDGPACEGQE